MNIKRAFLIGLIVSLSSSALIGIISLFMGHIWKFQEHMVFSMMTIALFSLTSLMTWLVLEKHVWRTAMIISLSISGIGATLYLMMIWLSDYLFDALPHSYGEAIGKVMAIIAVWAIGLPHAGLMSLVKLVGVLRYIKLATSAMIFVMVTTITLLITFELDDTKYFMFTACTVILVLLGTICTPILSKIQKIDKDTSVESTSLLVNMTCPRCFKQQVIKTGHARCNRCRLQIQLQVEEPRCPSCQYLLHHLTSPYCPECGAPLDEDEIPMDSADSSNRNANPTDT